MGGRFLILVSAGLVFATGLAPGSAGAEAIAVEAVPVPLSAEDLGLNTVGRLRYRGGLHLRAEDGNFGGLSALGISADGRRMLALSDG